jgi:hypothetical protein
MPMDAIQNQKIRKDGTSQNQIPKTRVQNLTNSFIKK